MNDTIQSQIRQRLLELIHSNFPLAESMGLTPEQNMLESGAVDSLGLLLVIEIVEREFEVKVNDADVVTENFGSVDALTSFIIKKKEATD